MNELNNDQEFVADREINSILKGRHGLDAEMKLAEIRNISNVRQALENLIVQCKASERFHDIETFAEEALALLEYEMQVKIHA